MPPAGGKCTGEEPGTGGETGGEDPGTGEDPGGETPGEEESAVFAFSSPSVTVGRGEIGEVTVLAEEAPYEGSVTWLAQSDTVTLLSQTSPFGGEHTQASVRFYAESTGQTAISAVYSRYEEGEVKTSSVACTVVVEENLGENTLALFTFEDEGESASAALAEGAEGIFAEYSQNTTQSGVAFGGKALEVSSAKGNAALWLTLPAALPDLAEGFTLSFLHNTTGGSDWSFIARTEGHSSIRFLNLCTNDTEEGNLYPNNNNNGGVGVLEEGFSWNALIADTGVWQHIAVTLNGEGVRFYKNGQLACTYSAADARVETVCSAFLQVLSEGGSLRLFGNNMGDGSDYIDDLRLSSYLGAAAVKELYEESGLTEQGMEIPSYDASLYPADPQFDALQGYGWNNEDTTTANVHDPSVFETKENGQSVFYSFSTDNFGLAGYQVRKSSDLIHWEYVGAAIQGFNENGAPPNVGAMSAQNELYAVWQVLRGDSQWSGSNASLWAPDVVPAPDTDGDGMPDGYWLYGSWTAGFGVGHSVIFRCSAEQAAGPYTYDDILVYSYDGWQNTPNAIDPQIYYTEDGGMYMAYGSFGGGIWALELDPATGLRKEESGLKGADWAELRNENGTVGGHTYTVAERYGVRLLECEDMEGPTVSYHERVPLYTGDPFAFDEAAVTYEDRFYLMGSANALSETYNMRSYVGYAVQPADEEAGGAGEGAIAAQSEGAEAAAAEGVRFSQAHTRVSGSFSWRHSAEDTRIGFDFGYPGHNDMLTTSGGVNLLVYHNRVRFNAGSTNHYLMLSMYAFDSFGRMVMNPNRYAGETLRKVEREEVYAAGGGYDFAFVTDNLYSASFNGGYAMSGLRLMSDGNVYFGAMYVGEWVLYGENWVYLRIEEAIPAANGSGFLRGAFYGVAFPAYIEAEGRGGLCLSLLDADGQRALFLNTNFS